MQYKRGRFLEESQKEYRKPQKVHWLVKYQAGCTPTVLLKIQANHVIFSKKISTKLFFLYFRFSHFLTANTSIKSTAMSFTGKFIIDGESEHSILDVQISASRTTDSNGRPNGLPTGGKIRLTIACPDAFNPFWGWMVNPQVTKDGSVEYTSEQGKPTRIVTFCNAYCVDYSERFISSGSTPMTVSVILTAETVGNGSDILNNNWGTPQ